MTATLSTLTHEILEDHRRLQRALAALEAELQPRDFAARRGVLAGRVVDLRHRLAAHFASEAEGGFFDRILRAAPECAGACSRLKLQHFAILAGLDRARNELPPASADAALVEAWIASIRAVLGEVDSHEEREARLLYAALEGAGGAPD